MTTATQYPTTLIVDGVSYTAVPGEAVCMADGRNVYINIYRDDVTIRANAHMGVYYKNVEEVNPHDVMYCEAAPAVSGFRKSGWSKATDTEWEAVQAAFLAAIVPGEDDETPYIIPVPANVSTPAFEEIVLQANKQHNQSIREAAAQSDDTQICWSCGGRFTYSQVKAQGGDWNVSGGCECGC